jgi:hypothetical protein
MMSIWSAALDALYRSDLAVHALLQPGSGSSETVVVRAMDLSAGVAVGDASEVKAQSLLPAAVVRMTELTAKGLTRDDVGEGTITMPVDEHGGLLPHSVTFAIAATQPKPSPEGEAKGELYIFLAGIA